MFWAYLKLKLKKYFRKNITAQKTKIFNYTVNHNDPASLFSEFKIIFKNKYYHFESLKKSPLIIDGGGHIGMSVLYFKQIYPDARILTFEPDPLALNFLKENMRENHIQNVRIIESGLFSRDGEQMFQEDNADGGKISAGGNQVISVERLSKYIGHEEVDFIKLNIEGAESAVLEDLDANNKLGYVREICLEWHSFANQKQDLGKILSILEKNDFKYLVNDFDYQTNGVLEPPFRPAHGSKYHLIVYAKKNNLLGQRGGSYHFKTTKKVLKNLHLLGTVKRMYFSWIKFRKNVYNFFHPTALILLYHRVAEVKDDPLLLSVSMWNFEEQIKYLKKNFNIIPLEKLADDLQNKKLKNKSVVITFDDGYADNFSTAWPILDKYSVPATVFVTTGYIDSQKSFYWDQETVGQDRGRPLSIEELKQLAQKPNIEIGAHTVNHRELAKLQPVEQKKEITDSKAELEKIVGRKIKSFAYPFGGKNSFNGQTKELVKLAGFKYACANIHERATKNSDILALPRFVVRNWNIKEFRDNLKKFI